jgi:colanic acid/amylovoran biosynthesis glycosyltransferase
VSQPAAGQAPRISYVIGTYPSLTTTFIDREISGLMERGVDVAIVSIRRPQGELSPDQQRLQSSVRYLLPPRWTRLLLACLLPLATRPIATLRLLASLVSRPHPEASRRRTILHVLTGLYAADVLADRRGVHLHAHFVDRAATVAMVAAQQLGTTYSVTAHANDIYVRPVLLREKLGKAAFAVTCTEFNLRHLRQELGAEATARLRRIYHGLDLDALRPGSTERDPKPQLLSVGQLKPKKGLHDLIDAVGALAADWPDLQCEIVGEGPLRGELQRRVKDLGLEGRIRLTGALPHHEVVARYARGPIFVLPCVVAADGDRDGIPNVILEAMAMELPVISTSISGIPEVVHPGDTGLLVPPGDVPALAAAIDGALRDPELRRRLGVNARAFVTDNFDQRQNVDRFLSAVLTR